MLTAEEIVNRIEPSFPSENEPFALTYSNQQMEAALNSAASLCLERRLSIIREILAGDIESENYRVEQRMRTTRRVDAALLKTELQAVYAACVYVDAADAKRLFGGAKALYAAVRSVAPERIEDFEHISLAELDALLSPAEQRRFITAESAPVGKPFIIRRDA